MSRPAATRDWLVGAGLAFAVAAVIGLAAIRDRALDRQEGAVERFLARPVSMEVQNLSAGEVLDALCAAELCHWHKDRGRIVIEPIEEVRP